MGKCADQQVMILERMAELGLQPLQVRGRHYFAGGVAGAAGVVGVAAPAGAVAPAGAAVPAGGVAVPPAAPPLSFTALFRSWAAACLTAGCTSGTPFSLSSVAMA